MISEKVARSGSAVLNRRTALSSALAGTVCAVLRKMPAAKAQAKKYSGLSLVYASWGGLHQAAHKKSWCDPFSQKTGANITQDTLLSYAKLRTDLEAGRSVWDVVDINSGFFYSTKNNNYFLPIDRSIVHGERVRPALVDQFGIGCEVWAYTLGYNGSAITEGARRDGAISST